MSEAHAAAALGQRIGWRCRRGLLELDLWLGGFWAAHRATLHPHETAAFERLLGLSDMEIADWLHGRTPVGDPSLEALVQRLRDSRAVSTVEAE